MSFDLLSFSIGGVLLAPIVIFLLKNWIQERLKQSIDYEYKEKLSQLESKLEVQKEIELIQLKDLVDKKISTLNLANTTYGATQSLLYSKKLDALEKAWNAFLHISKNKPSIIGGRLDILTPQEYENLFDIPAMRNFPIVEDDVGQLIKKLSDIVDPIENLKIYIDDDIWTFLFIYRAVMLRTYYLIAKAKENRQLKLRWHKDSVILNHLNMIFNQSELQEFEKIQIGKFRYVENVLEAKLKVRIEEGFSGGKASEAMLQQALQNQLMLDKLSKN